MYKKINIYSANQGAKQQPTQSDFKEILDNLNSNNFTTRIDAENVKYVSPNFEDTNPDCHTVARIFAQANKWDRVSGYLIEQEKLDAGVNFIKLTAHSVVKDKNSNFLEFMKFIYPLIKYYFILHKSGSNGYDLRAIA